ncbi:DEAD/DEAH box helicase [Gluconobacter cerinus]|uniref:DEAD/DEAH box helicase n=1 Tax=Gluconobacter cerinus TaxID=38307 RepID=UPI00193F6661|nr:DEAD/DEAH box helicase [Gluconobacter cerinus]MBM3098576.1 DEAD/DEAH box helicase [Gluconobacter cerinus]
MVDATTIGLARDIRGELAPDRLTPAQAKLYSQRIRRDMGRDGLASFTAGEIQHRLEEALLLIEAAWLERTGDGGVQWRQSLKRAAEILEWLAQPTLRPSDVPVHLLSAAAYQLAGYPAMALGQLQRMPDDQPHSVLLRNFIRADFPAALAATHKFWATQRSFEAEIARDGGMEERDLGQLAIRHVIMCLGTICAYMRSGNDALVERALTKLGHLASSYLHSRDSYSYLLARLTSEIARGFIEQSLWPKIAPLSSDGDRDVAAALVQFARSAFMNRRALVWPAQAEGIARLADQDSFVLCTPTGSGKTTIATLGAVQGLFAPRANPFLAANLVLYLVPSRALAAEVEARLAEDLRGVAAQPIVVTGLYGGVDWGPTDAWIDVDQPAVVICTFEKADALLRYLGVLFLDRVRTVVIDEAHMVDQDPRRVAGVADGSSRSLRLEQLSTRLLRARDEKGFRLIALSAVAAKAAPAMAAWFGEGEDAIPVVSSHRSTRQMLGTLEVGKSGRFDIRYNLMDGHSLAFEDERKNDSPYIPRPFPPLPGGIDEDAGPEVRMRAPTLWSALHLAAERTDGVKPTVLISIMQNVTTFAETCAELMDEWGEGTLPNYWQVDQNDSHWQRCLSAAEDYFTKKSFEYRLLVRGIAVHHGQMPALLARRLKVAIDRGQVRVIIATSTLSEGVNIPVSTILLPSVYRGEDVMSAAEFSNLIGRAGRPGVATEGSALVVLPEREYERRRGKTLPEPVWNRQWNGYNELVSQLESAAQLAAAGGATAREQKAHSALAMLLTALRDTWEEISESDDDDDFLVWLEKTAISEAENEGEETGNYLDSLDGILLAFIQEIESLTATTLSATEMEAELARIWRNTYAYAAADEEARLSKFWLARGQAIKEIYPDPDQRRRLYRTSLGPRSGQILLDRVDTIREALAGGADYVDRTTEQQLEFIRSVLDLLSDVPAFAIGRTLGRKKNFDDWPKLLRWWLARSTLKPQPKARELSNWFKFVADNFIYRGSWGLGSVIGVLLDKGGDGEPIDALTIDDWPKSGLPWIAFWLKELINWGTLDPVAAFLLARGDAIDRSQAEADAQAYYETQAGDADPNGLLDPRAIRDWIESRRPVQLGVKRSAVPMLDAELVRPATQYLYDRLSVYPIEEGDTLIWIDPAGYTVAKSNRPTEWGPNAVSDFTFELSVRSRRILAEAYLPHR